MPLYVPPELQFSVTGSAPLPESAVEAFLSIARKITSDKGRQRVLERFKEHFCNASGSSYAPSSTVSWAESDLNSAANGAAENAAGFIAAFYHACEDLERSGSSVPNSDFINKMLDDNNVPFQIIDGSLIQTTDYIPPPEILPTSAEVVARALADAKALVGHGNASSAIDRAHTALHGYLLELCSNVAIDTTLDTTISAAFKLLRTNHPAFQATGPRADDISRLLKSFATSIDSFTPIRNKASLAHANELLDEPEARAVISAIYTVFRYIQDCLHRYETGGF